MSNIVYSFKSGKKQGTTVAFLTLNYFNNAITEGHRILSKRIIDTVQDMHLNTYIFSLEMIQYTSQQENLSYNQLLPNYWDWAFSTFKIFKKLKTCDANIIHVLSYNKPFPALLNKLSSIRSRRYKIIAHLYYSPDAFRNLSYKLTELLLKARFFDAIITTSNSLKEFLIEKLGLSDKMVFHLPPIVPREFFDFDYQLSRNLMTETRKIFGFNKNHFVVSYIGHLIPQRGIFELLKAFKEASRSNNNLKLVISYPNIFFRDLSLDYLTILQMLIKKYALEHKVLIIGKQNLNTLYTISDVLFFGFDKSFFFTFPPLVVCEAMAAGVPFILKRSPVVNELFHDESSVPIYQDAYELTEILLNLANDKSTLYDFSTKIKTEAIKRFLPELGALKLHRIYSSLSGDDKK